MISVLELRSVRGTGGGPEKTILFGAARHDRSRFRVTVCYIRDARDTRFGLEARARQLGINYVEVSERHSLDRTIWPQLVKIVRELRIDIIHGHEYKSNLLAWLLGRKTGAIALATAHGWTGDSARERWVYYPADRQVLRRLPRVIAVSSDIRARLVKAGAAAARVPVLLNGIEPADFRRDGAVRDRIRREMGFLLRDQVIGAVGRLEHQKRFDLLLEAFARLRRDWPHARLVLVGDGSLRDRLERQAVRLGLGHACQFLGHRLDIAGLHNAFDLFVQSSEYEGTPNAVLEAMAMETPIVATAAGGTSELAVAGDHALIVPSDDSDALRQAMQAALADPVAASRRAAAARQRIERDLSFAERTRRLEDIYVDLMGECGRSIDRDAGADAFGARSA